MVLDKVKKMLAGQLAIKEEKIQENSRIIEDLGADSLDVVELLMTLEDEYDIVLSDDQAINVKTVANIVELIESKKK